MRSRLHPVDSGAEYFEIPGGLIEDRPEHFEIRVDCFDDLVCDVRELRIHVVPFRMFWTYFYYITGHLTSAERRCMMPARGGRFVDVSGKVDEVDKVDVLIHQLVFFYSLSLIFRGF